MAKYEASLRGDFYTVLNTLDSTVIGGSISASREDSSDFTINNVKCAVRVYERYSYIGKNRVSMSIILIGHGDDLRLSAITSGGSGAVFLKINTFGEQAFLDKLVASIEAFRY